MKKIFVILVICTILASCTESGDNQTTGEEIAEPEVAVETISESSISESSGMEMQISDDDSLDDEANEPEETAENEERSDTPEKQQIRAELLELLPYTQPNMISTEPNAYIEDYYLFHNTAEGRMLANYLYYVTYHALVPEESFSSLEELDELLIINISLNNNVAFSNRNFRDKPYYRIPHNVSTGIPVVSDDILQLLPEWLQNPQEFQLMEHLEMTARYIFGDSVSLTYNVERKGLWTLIDHLYYRHGEGYGLVNYVVPVVMDYKELDDCYIVDACIIGVYGPSDPDQRYYDYSYGDGTLTGYDSLSEFCQEAGQYQFTLRKQGDTLIYAGCKVPD